MEKKAKIKSTVFKKEWTAPKGDVFYFHEIELDNGDKGEIGCKVKMPADLAVGKEFTYTIESGQYGNKIKAVSDKPAYSGGRKGPDPKVQLAGFAMSYTKDLIIGGKIDIKDLVPTFEKIHNIMSSKL